MTKSEIFKKAHKLAKEWFVNNCGHYLACFKGALKSVYQELKLGFKKIMDIQELAKAINDSGYKYYGEKAKAWSSKDGAVERIYFGADYATVENSKAHNAKTGKARANTIGYSAVEAINNIIGANK